MGGQGGGLSLPSQPDAFPAAKPTSLETRLGQLLTDPASLVFLSSLLSLSPPPPHSFLIWLPTKMNTSGRVAPQLSRRSLRFARLHCPLHYLSDGRG